VKLGTGIGYTSLKAIESIRQAGFLKQVITLDDIPVQSNDSIIKDNIFDILASMRISKPVDVLHGWGHGCYAQIQKAHSLNAKTIVERASSHINTQNRLLLEEYKKFNIKTLPIHPWIIKKSLMEFKETDFIAVPSRFAYNSFINEGYPEHKLVLNPFGVDINRFKPMNIKNDDIFRVLFVGENWVRKGVYYLLKAWNNLDLKNAELVIRSNIPFFQDIDYKAIKLLGWVDDIIRLYNNVDVFCLPTIEEGNALVVGEVSSCSIPSITTFNAGTWLDEKSCFFIPIRDIDALEKQIQYCYDNPDELKKTGREARKKAEENTWDHYGRRLIENYKKIVN
jgi:glycosyltransferase involved in cell wall biosynthesis